MSLSEFYPELKGWTPVEPKDLGMPAPDSGLPGPSQSPQGETPSSPYLRASLPLPLQYAPDTLKQYNRPGLSTFRIAPLPASGLPSVNSNVQSSFQTIPAQILSENVTTQITNVVNNVALTPVSPTSSLNSALQGYFASNSGTGTATAQQQINLFQPNSTPAAALGILVQALPDQDASAIVEAISFTDTVSAFTSRDGIFFDSYYDIAAGKTNSGDFDNVNSNVFFNTLGGSGTHDEIRGNISKFTVSGGVIVDAVGYGVQMSIDTTGSMTNCMGVRVESTGVSGTGAITNNYGFRAQDLSSASTFSAAFYADSQGVAAGHYAYYSAGATPSLFGGPLTTANIILTAATPTTAAGQVGLGTTAGFGTGAAGTGVTTTTKGAGSGPTTAQTIVNYLEIDIAGTKYWIPLMQ